MQPERVFLNLNGFGRLGREARAQVATIAGSALAVTAVSLPKWLYWASGPPALAGTYAAEGAITVPIIALCCFATEIWLAIRRDIVCCLIFLWPAFAFLMAAGSLPVQLMIFHTSRSLPLVDAHLARLDAWLGFDWTAYFGWVAARPVAITVLSSAYASIYVQPVLIAGFLLVEKDVGSSCRLQMALLFAFLGSCLVALLFPALGAYAFHGMVPGSHPNLVPEFTNGMSGPITFLRSHAVVTALPAFPDLRVISFPSFHAAAAIVFAGVAWRIVRLRYFVLGLNGLMVAATPVMGSHYLVDVVAGLALGAAALLAADEIVRRAAAFGAALGSVPPALRPAPAGSAGAA